MNVTTPVTTDHGDEVREAGGDAESEGDEEERLKMDREVEMFDESSPAVEERQDQREDREQAEHELRHDGDEVVLKSLGVAGQAAKRRPKERGGAVHRARSTSRCSADSWSGVCTAEADA